MKKVLRFAIVVLAIGSGCSAQTLVTVRGKGAQKWPAEEADKLYLAACSSVERDWGGDRVLRPKVTVVLGAVRNEASLQDREIRLATWDPYLFAQGVVVFAFQDLLSAEQVAIAKRAVNRVKSTVEVKALAR